MKYEIRRAGRKKVWQGKVLTFYEDTMILPDGRTESWDYIRHPRNGACVVPVLPDGRILMIRQYRPAIDRETLELPAGVRDILEAKTGDEPVLEEPCETARRELREETGYACGRLTHLLRLKTAVAWCSETTDVYLAEDLSPAGEQALDEAEEIRAEAFPEEELLGMIHEGRIEDAKTAAGILAYHAYRQKKEEGV